MVTYPKNAQESRGEGKEAMNRWIWILGALCPGLLMAGCAGKSLKKDYNEGVRLYEAGEAEQALGHLEKVAERDPDQPRYQHALDLAYNDLARYGDAERCYLEAIRLDPREPRWQVGLAITLHNRGA